MKGKEYKFHRTEMQWVIYVKFPFLFFKMTFRNAQSNPKVYNSPQFYLIFSP